jgi:sugar/nucleoside kinase (ribokinase family)
LRASAGCLHGESEMRDAEVHGEPDDPKGPAASPDVVVIGHAGISIVHAGNLSWTSAGGSGYAVAASAAALIGQRAGLVAAVGRDLDLGPLRRLHADLAGVTELPGPSAKLRIREFDDGTRSFSAELGVAATVRADTFPPCYLDARHIHLGTAPPDQQLTWLEYLRDRGCRAQISADMFEHYVATYPTASREVCDSVDLIFMNQAEYDGLYGDAQLPVPKAPLIVKRGSSGARLIVDGHPQEVEAARIQVVDPTGAGEVLAGVFLALRAAGQPDREALKYAVRAAASCAADYGVTGSHLTVELEAIRREVAADG